MTGKLALDSNAVIACQRGESSILKLIKGKFLYLPSPVLGELTYGAIASSKPEQNLNLFLQFAAQCVVPAIDANVALLYARVRKRLRDKGQPIPENDLWIASICLENDLPLLTKDKHFESVEDLVKISW